MSMQTGSIDADGLARTTDGKLYVTLGGGAASLTTLALGAGTAAAPSITLSADTNTGWYSSAANQWAWSSSGTPVYQMVGLAMKMANGQSMSWTNNASAVAGTVDTTLTRQSAGLLCVDNTVATPAGGSATTGPALVFGSTAGFGIYIGSGVPTLSAAQGSLYLRSDGSTTATRAYINTNGATTWTNLVTAA